VGPSTPQRVQFGPRLRGRFHCCIWAHLTMHIEAVSDLLFGAVVDGLSETSS
jgi:hypothetical protein